MAHRNPLAFLDHVHQFDALQGGLGRVKGFDPVHRPDDPFVATFDPDLADRHDRGAV